MAAPFAHELGCFDPTFPGISLHFANEQAWLKYGEVMALYQELGGRDLREKNPQLKPEDVTPRRIYDHVMASVEHGLNASLEEKDRIGRDFIARDPQNAVGNVALASVFEHERRHFHDWLLSPYTAAQSLMRAEVFFNYGSGLRRELHDKPVTALPVPVMRWLRKPEDERQALAGMWQSLLGEGFDFQLPDFEQPGLREALDNISRRYRSLGALFEPLVPGTQLDAAGVFEASALCIQTQAIHDLLGETASQLFTGTMSTLGQKSRYSWFLQGIGSLQKPGERLENDALSTVATWCLLGNNTADSDHAHPISRFIEAHKCLQACGLSALEEPAAQTFDRLDAAARCVPWREALHHSVELGEGITRQFAEQAADERTGTRFLAGIAQTQGFLHRCHAYMVRLLLDDPDGYCKPARYLDHTLEKLPEPPLRHTFGRPFRIVPRAMLANFERATLYEAECTEKEAVLRETVIQLPRGVVDLQIADNWQYLCIMTDTVFAEYHRDRPEIDWQRERALNEGVRYLEVLS